VPVEDPPSRRRLIAILRSYAKDNVKGRQLHPDGTYERFGRPGERARTAPAPGAPVRVGPHRREAAGTGQRTVFEPHRAAGKEE